MWKLLTPYAREGNSAANRRKAASFASVGAVILCYWACHVAALLCFMGSGLRLMVVGNACGILTCFVAFWYNRKGVFDLAIFLINLEIALYCLLSVLMLGWEANTQWFLLCAILPCQVAFPLGKRMRRIYTGFFSAVLVLCFTLQDLSPPYYRVYHIRSVVLLNIFAALACSLLVLRFNAIGNKEATGYYEQRISHLSNDAYIDALTGLWNRRYAMEQLSNMVSNAPGSCFSIAMLDVDFFKNTNDTYGHPYGDVVLQRLSNLILHHFRSNDIAVRWGGEEFLIILPGADVDQMYPKLEDLRAAVQKMEITDQNITTSITVTVGLSEYREGMHVNEVIHQSDVALYYGKRNGRNQVIRYRDLPASELVEVKG